MAFKKTLAQRLSNVYKTTGFSISACRISSSSMSARKLVPPHPDDKIAPDPGDNGIFRRFIQRRLINTYPATSPELRSLPIGESLIEKIREMDVNRSRIKLDGFLPPLEMRPEPEPEITTEGKLTVADAKKLLKISQLEMVKLRLKQTEKNCISYPEFVQICSGISSNNDLGMEFAKILDDSGTVLVLGNVVFLRPDQVGFLSLFFILLLSINLFSMLLTDTHCYSLVISSINVELNFKKIALSKTDSSIFVFFLQTGK